MTTASEFVKGGITGQTFREITEKFGKPLDQIPAEDKMMSLFAMGFAWFREREHLSVPDAYSKAMGCTPEQISDLFEPETKKTKAEADFDSQPPTTTP